MYIDESADSIEKEAQRKIQPLPKELDLFLFYILFSKIPNKYTGFSESLTTITPIRIYFFICNNAIRSNPYIICTSSTYDTLVLCISCQLDGPTRRTTKRRRHTILDLISLYLLPLPCPLHLHRGRTIGT